ncbi:MAG: hypothetical protein KHW81_10185 [[Clostridium] innocuum]|nr:hypothetical protein [[Clostridium] innocuum]MBS5684765.1 hypothetical protein [[Clostridium] innocuum]
MMISPEGYYEEYLKGKNEKQIMTAIHGLKQEMGRLKNTMESPDYGSEAIIMPSESTRLWCTRLYLDRAKQALADVGGTYVPSKAEQKAELFDASIPAISRVIFGIGGFFGGYETRTITVDEEHIHFDVEHSLILKPSNLPDWLDYPCDKDEFLDGLRELHIGEWRTNYMNPYVLDGTQWELTIELSDGHKPFKTGGSNAYPYNFDALQELLGIEPDEDADE